MFNWSITLEHFTYSLISLTSLTKSTCQMYMYRYVYRYRVMRYIAYNDPICRSVPEPEVVFPNFFSDLQLIIAPVSLKYITFSWFFLIYFDIFLAWKIPILNVGHHIFLAMYWNFISYRGGILKEKSCNLLYFWMNIA